MKIKKVPLYRFAFHKARFEYGYGITNYLKLVILLFGVSSQNVLQTMIIAVIYAISCYFVGMICYKYGLVVAEAEVSNQYNLFVKEMRHNYSAKRK